jgi:hypothetical protein
VSAAVRGEPEQALPLVRPSGPNSFPAEVSFRLTAFPIRERADPKGAKGGGGRTIPATQSRMQVRTRPCGAARRPARKSTRGHQARMQAWTGRPGRRSFPPPRLWKLTGCGKLRTTSHPPPDLPTTVGNPAPIHRPGFPQLPQPRRARSISGRKALIAIFLCGFEEKGSRPRGLALHGRQPWDDYPSARSRSTVRGMTSFPPAS